MSSGCITSRIWEVLRPYRVIHNKLLGIQNFSDRTCNTAPWLTFLLAQNFSGWTYNISSYLTFVWAWNFYNFTYNVFLGLWMRNWTAIFMHLFLHDHGSSGETNTDAFSVRYERLVEFYNRMTGEFFLSIFEQWMRLL